MSIMTQLEFELDFSESEKDIARYILDKQENILDFPGFRHLHLHIMT